MRSLFTKWWESTRLLCLLVPVLLLAAASAGCVPCYLELDPPKPKEIEAHRVRSQFARWAERNYGLETVATSGSMMDDIRMVGLWFDSRQRMSIPEARLLLVTLIREFVRQVNADEGIRPYLENYPATEENVEVRVSFKNRHDTWFASPFVAFGYWDQRGIIEYVHAKYPNAKRGREGNWRDAIFHDRHRETWQEAVKLVERGETGED